LGSAPALAASAIGRKLAKPERLRRFAPDQLLPAANAAG
jgi:hypothetical protein